MNESVEMSKEDLTHQEHRMEEDVKSQRILVIGLGGAGGRIVGALASMPEAFWLEKLVLDTDKNSLGKCGLGGGLRILLDEGWRKGRGCGGEMLEGERSVSRERNRLSRIMGRADMIIVAGGMGGGLCGGGAPVLARMARRLGIPALFMLATPFAMESGRRTDAAEKGLSELLNDTRLVLVFPNDLLFSNMPADILMTDAFDGARLRLAAAILAVAENMRDNKMLSYGLSDFAALLEQGRAFAGVGIGEAGASDHHHKAHAAVERMLES